MAEAVREFLPNVLEGLKVFLSSEDIRRGAAWLSTIRTELETTDFGVLCLTREAMASPWLLFESGAIAKKVEAGHVVPLYVGIAQADVVAPLSHFQGMVPTAENFKKLIREMNSSAGDSQIDDVLLMKRFEKWWPDLETAIAGVLQKVGADVKPTATRDVKDM